MKTKFVITHLIISCTFALQAADSYQAEIQLINSILLERKEFYEKFPCPKSVRYNPEQNKDPLFNQKKLAALKSLENKKALYASLYPDSQRLSISFIFGSTIPLQYLSDARKEVSKTSSLSPKVSTKSSRTLPTSSIRQNTKLSTPLVRNFKNSGNTRSSCGPKGCKVVRPAQLQAQQLNPKDLQTLQMLYMPKSPYQEMLEERQSKIDQRKKERIQSQLEKKSEIEKRQQARLAQLDQMAPVHDSQFRTFTGKNGNTMEAKLVAFSAFLKKAEIQDTDGKNHEIPLSHFSRKDFQYLQKWWP